MPVEAPRRRAAEHARANEAAPDALADKGVGVRARDADGRPELEKLLERELVVLKGVSKFE